jgi:HKD family nuclease
MTLPRGLYDLVLTSAVSAALEAEPAGAVHLSDLHPDEAPERLAEVLGAELRRILDESGGVGGDRLRAQLDLLNGMLRDLRTRHAPVGGGGADEVVEGRLLRAIHPTTTQPPTPPETGLAAPWLFTAGKGSPSLLTELRREAAACDEIDILVSFITVSGVRKLIDVLRRRDRGGRDGAGSNADPRAHHHLHRRHQIQALDELARLNGCEVRVSLDGRRTRLHAKAWIFKRKTGFGSAYVGSANLSGAALMGGLEWTVKFTQKGEEDLYERAIANFDTLWADEEFTPFDPDDARTAPPSSPRCAGRAGATAPRRSPSSTSSRAPSSGDAGRDRARAGAGAAAQPARRRDRDGQDRRRGARLPRHVPLGGQRPRLLFVAHRAQILRQALRTYREVLRDHSFGEVLSGGVEPSSTIPVRHHRQRDHRDLVDAARPGVLAHRRDRRVPPAGGEAVHGARLHGPPAPPARPHRDARAADGVRSSPSSIPGRTAPPPSSCGSGTRSTCSCSRPSSTSPATTRPTSPTSRGTPRPSGAIDAA